QLDAVIELDDIEGFDVVGRLQDAFVEAEADGEIRQVLRRAHHHGVGTAIIGQRQRGLLRNDARALGETAVSPGFPLRWAGRAARHYSAASAGAMPRECLACSS